MSNQSNIDTEKIARKINEIQAQQNRTPSGMHRIDCCPQAKRIDNMEAKLDRHEERFNDGEKQFIRLENGLASVAEKVGTLNTILAWVGGIVGVGLLGTAGTALVYVIGLMGGKS